MIAILAVAAPALVTYSTKVDVGSDYQLAAILLTGVAGAATTLQAIFGFRQGYIREATTALGLREIVQDLHSASDLAFKLKDKFEAFAKARNALEKARLNTSELLMNLERSKIKEYSSE